MLFVFEMSLTALPGIGRLCIPGSLFDGTAGGRDAVGAFGTADGGRDTAGTLGFAGGKDTAGTLGFAGGRDTAGAGTLAGSGRVLICRGAGVVKVGLGVVGIEAAGFGAVTGAGFVFSADGAGAGLGREMPAGVFILLTVLGVLLESLVASAPKAVPEKVSKQQAAATMKILLWCIEHLPVGLPDH